jgi:uncharacterized protein YdeI (YjbR/CyaY-like superfamily)
MGKPLRTLDVPSRKQWRDWLRRHHDSVTEVWLVFHKGRAVRRGVDYEDAIDEALCFGWVDSLVKRLDADRYVRKFTPRKAASRWSTLNRRRYARLKKAGLLAAPGRARAPTSRSGDAPRPSTRKMPAYLEDELAANARARGYFEALPPSQQRMYIGWIDSAKREETRRRRLGEAITRLAAGKRLGLK